MSLPKDKERDVEGLHCILRSVDECAITNATKSIHFAQNSETAFVESILPAPRLLPKLHERRGLYNQWAARWSLRYDFIDLSVVASRNQSQTFGAEASPAFNLAVNQMERAFKRPTLSEK